MNRHNFLLGTTAVVAASGATFALWPFVDQMNPDADIAALGDGEALDLSIVSPGQPAIISWRNLPIFIVQRNVAAQEALRQFSWTRQLRDPQSTRRQQPAFAQNWHRSMTPETGVFIGICTHCRCKIVFEATSVSTQPDGFICPCCASRYDLAGRAFAGPSQFNLPVPPYAFDATQHLEIGGNAREAMSFMKDIERL